jgi:hypothetical protein
MKGPMKKSDAFRIVGGLSSPSKMPGMGYGLSPTCCRTGGKLRKVRGSVCSRCYACKGHYTFAGVADCHARRLASITHPQWVEAMVALIKGQSFFRWHDSGDIQSLAHLRQIVDVCRHTPGTRHWMPTREHGIVARYLATGGKIPPNLVIRYSSPMLGQGPCPIKGLLTTSTVGSGAGHRCPATYGDFKTCDEAGCKACWDRKVRNVDYRVH